MLPKIYITFSRDKIPKIFAADKSDKIAIFSFINQIYRENDQS